MDAAVVVIGIIVVVGSVGVIVGLNGTIFVVAYVFVSVKCPN